MSQPPYPPQGGSEPGGEQSGWQGRPPPTGNEPTQRLGPAGEWQRDQTQQFPPPGPYGQPGQYAPPPHGQQGPYGQPGQYAPPPYGQPGQYGAPGQYGQPWAPPGGSGGAPPKRDRSTLIALVVAGVVVLAAVGVALFLVFGRDDPSAVATGTEATTSTSEETTSSSEETTSSSEETTSSSAETTTPTDEPTDGGPPPAPSVSPEGLGDDPVLDALALACFIGDMQSCDTLYDDSASGSDYESYGDSCAGRQPTGTLVYCTKAFGEG